MTIFSSVHDRTWCIILQKHHHLLQFFPYPIDISPTKRFIHAHACHRSLHPSGRSVCVLWIFQGFKISLRILLLSYIVFFCMVPVISECNILTKKHVFLLPNNSFLPVHAIFPASRTQGVYPTAISTPLALVISLEFWQYAFFRHVTFTCERRSCKAQSHQCCLFSRIIG